MEDFDASLFSSHTNRSGGYLEELGKSCVGHLAQGLLDPVNAFLSIRARESFDFSFSAGLGDSSSGYAKVKGNLLVRHFAQGLPAPMDVLGFPEMTLFASLAGKVDETNMDICIFCNFTI